MPVLRVPEGPWRSLPLLIMPFPAKSLDDYLAETVAALDGCLIWYGRPSKSKAHCKKGSLPKLILERKLGRKLRRYEVPRHTCDVARCLNEDHLIPGTQGDNNRDTVARNRDWKAQSKLNPVLRKEIVARYKFGGISQGALAYEYGVSQTAISFCIRKGRYG